MKKSAWAWILGLGAAAMGAFGIYTYEKKKTAALPGSVAPPTLTKLSGISATGVGDTLQQGTKYVCAGLVPPGIASSAANFQAELSGPAVGWSNVQVLWFGPTGESNDVSNIANQPAVAVHRIASQTIFSGTWSGLSGTPFPPNVDVWAIA